MNDDFLRRLRRPPSAGFERELRERLRQQEPSGSTRRRPSWRLLTITLLLGGTALATATYLTLKRAPSAPSQLIQTDTAATAPAAANEIQNRWQATHRPTDELDQGRGPTDAPSSASQEQASSGITSRNKDPLSNEARPGGDAEMPAYISSTGAGTSRTTRPIRIVLSPDIESLAKDTSEGSRSSPEASFEVERADVALPTLCADEERARPDIVVTSRPARKEELRRCRTRFDSDVLQTKLGHVAIVVTRAKTGTSMQLSTRTLRLALLKQVPAPDDSSQLIDNPYTHWNQIDRSLEERRIEVLGPARNTPEFMVFAATVLAPACENRAPQDQQLCQTLREDGVYAEARYDSNFVPQRLWSDPNVVAIMDYRFYAANSADLLNSLLAGAAPTRESIVDGSYVGARTLHAYVNRDRYNVARVRWSLHEYLRLTANSNRKLQIPADGNIDGPRPHDAPRLTEVKLD